MIIVLYGYQFLKKKKKIIAVILFLFATTFHTTAIISFFLFLNIKAFKKRKFVFGITFCCIVVSRIGILNQLINVLVPRYSHYLDSRYASTGWLAVSYSLIVYTIWYILVNISIEKDNVEDNIISTNFALLLIFAAFGFSVNLFTRAGEYFLLIAITEIPNMLYREKVKYFREWLLSLCLLLLVMFLITLILRPGWNHLYPYEFWR